MSDKIETEEVIKNVPADEAGEVDEENLEDTVPVRVYEIGYHIAPVMNEEHIPAEVVVIKDLIEKGKGRIISEEFPKVKILAYTISKIIDGKKHNFEKAYFGWIKFEMDGSEVLKVKKALDVNEKILRFLLIKTVKEDTKIFIPKFDAQIKNDGDKKFERKEKESVNLKEKVEISAEEIDKKIEGLLS